MKSWGLSDIHIDHIWSYSTETKKVLKVINISVTLKQHLATAVLLNYS